MRNIIFIFTILPLVLFGQTATFSADTTQFYREKNSRTDIYDKIMEAEWKINGHTLHYGSRPITVKTNYVVDTVFYKQYKNSKWDTLICNISKPENYTFYYNECCGGFNISDETNKFIVGSVTFIINGSDQERQYLGMLGEAGILVNPASNGTLKPGCRSAMSPNVYQLTLSEIEICKDPGNCNEETCLYEKGKEELNYEFGYKTISRKLDCLFLPLSNHPIKVIYDPGTGKIKIE